MFVRNISTQAIGDEGGVPESMEPKIRIKNTGSYSWASWLSTEVFDWSSNLRHLGK